MSLKETLPGFDQHLPSKRSVFPLFFGAEHYQSLEIVLTDVGQHYLEMDLFNIELSNDVAFCQRTFFRETKVCRLLSLKQSPFLVMTS
jgi:hypothetical protein